MSGLPTADEAARAAGVTIERASRQDLPDILDLQHEAFGRIAKHYGLDPDVLPPTRENLLDLEHLFDSGYRFFAARADGRMVGTVRTNMREDGTVEIGRLAVDEGYLRRGIARALMLHIEEAHADAYRFELFTGARASEPLALYDQLGYKIYRSRMDRDIEIVWLEKQGPAAL